LKIIGKTENNGLLLSASRDEVAHLIGYFSTYSRPVSELLEPGKEIKISAMYNQFYQLQGKAKELERVATQLEAIAALLRVENPIVEEVVHNFEEANATQTEEERKNR